TVYWPRASRQTRSLGSTPCALRNTAKKRHAPFHSVLSRFEHGNHCLFDIRLRIGGFKSLQIYGPKREAVKQAVGVAFFVQRLLENVCGFCLPKNLRERARASIAGNF